MGLYADQLLPRLIDLTLRGEPIERLRRRATADLHGTVLEVGFGSGRNVPHYPPGVDRVLAVDPSTVGRALAADRVSRSPVPVEYVGLDGQHLPLADRSVDAALTTWTLCTIPDVATALAEIRRVLRPGGALHFVEHGRAADPRVARWQDRLTPIQRKLVGGCHLNRPVDQLVAAAGFEIERLDTFYLNPLKPFAAMYAGRATRT